jgi:hypothetical protein
MALLDQYADRGSVVLDPFCGKGTALLAARLLGMTPYGADIGPEAVACTQAKLACVTLDQVLEYIGGLETDSPDQVSVTDDVLVFFHPDTVRQLLSIRARLLGDCASACTSTRSAARFTLGILLGILHGHASYSLSIPSAHAYSMAANYVRTFASQHGLERPLRDLKDCLAKKAIRCLSKPLPDVGAGEATWGSALELSELFPGLVGQVDVVLTSPPYLNAQTYAKDNWLRLWYLGHEYRNIHARAIQTGSIRRYSETMKRVLEQIYLMLRPNGLLICIAGDVRLRVKEGERTFETGTHLAQLCCTSNLGFQISHSSDDEVSRTSRYLHALSQSNGHRKRALVERTFVAHKL